MVISSIVYKPFSEIHLVSVEARLELKGGMMGTTIPVFNTGADLCHPPGIQYCFRFTV